MITQNKERKVFSGLSTDDKTSVIADNGDIFEEMDTGDKYQYDGENEIWYKIT